MPDTTSPAPASAKKTPTDRRAQLTILKQDLDALIAKSTEMLNATPTNRELASVHNKLQSAVVLCERGLEW